MERIAREGVTNSRASTPTSLSKLILVELRLLTR